MATDGSATTSSPTTKGPQDACGVFGVWPAAPGEEVAKLTYFGLYALQHRGQESAGIAVSDGSQILVYKDMGLVSQVFDEGHLDALRGHVAIGHTRYSTTGASVWENAQPTFRSTANGSIALGHNGNLTNTRDLLTLVEKREAESGMLPYDEWHRRRRPGSPTTDSEIISALLASYPDRSLESAALEVLPAAARRVLAGLHGREHALRRPRPAGRPAAGARPAGARLGRRAARPRRWTSSAPRGARGRARRADRDRRARPAHAAVRRRRSRRAACSSTSTWPGRTPRSPAARCTRRGSRSAAGSRSRRPVEADLVIPVPESGTPAAVGYSQGSGIPYGLGLVKNSYVGRTFIQPSQTIRQLGIRLKLNPLQRRHRRQAAGRRRRLDRARQHPAGAGADAARGGRRSRCTCASPRRR